MPKLKPGFALLQAAIAKDDLPRLKEVLADPGSAPEQQPLPSLFVLAAREAREKCAIFLMDQERGVFDPRFAHEIFSVLPAVWAPGNATTLARRERIRKHFSLAYPAAEVLAQFHKALEPSEGGSGSNQGMAWGSALRQVGQFYPDHFEALLREAPVSAAPQIWSAMIFGANGYAPPGAAQLDLLREVFPHAEPKLADFSTPLLRSTEHDPNGFQEWMIARLAERALPGKDFHAQLLELFRGIYVPALDKFIQKLASSPLADKIWGDPVLVLGMACGSVESMRAWKRYHPLPSPLLLSNEDLVGLLQKNGLTVMKYCLGNGMPISRISELCAPPHSLPILGFAPAHDWAELGKLFIKHGFDLKAPFPVLSFLDALCSFGRNTLAQQLGGLQDAATLRREIAKPAPASPKGRPRM